MTNLNFFTLSKSRDNAMQNDENQISQFLIEHANKLIRAIRVREEKKFILLIFITFILKKKRRIL